MPGPKIMANIPKTFEQGVAKPAMNHVNESFKDLGESIFGNAPTPQNQQNQQQTAQQSQARQAVDAQRKQNLMRYFDSLKMNSQIYRQKQESALNIKRQKETDEQNRIRQFQFEKKQKQQQNVSVFRGQRKTEIKVKGG
jgi:hypothetical protein